MRTGTEGSVQTDREPVRTNDCSFETDKVNKRSSATKPKKLSDFRLVGCEQTAMTELQEELNQYMVQKHALRGVKPEKTLLNIQEYLQLSRATHTEKSIVEYRQVLDAKADSKDTMMALIDDLHKEYIVENKQQWLIVEGDAKTYEILKSLKCEYGEDLSWLIPYPGDWHMLYNYQYPLMKAYYDAGLKSLAQAAAYPLNQIQQCAQFKRTHYFLLEVWEAAYCTMLSSFLSTLDEKKAQSSSDLQQSIVESLLKVRAQREPTMTTTTLRDHLEKYETKLASQYKELSQFLQNQARIDHTWRFWIQFVFEDAMAYIGLFLAIRSGNWNLRTASMKKIAPIFTAFDHQTYQKTISTHIVDILEMPSTILAMFQQGALVVSIKGKPWHSVAIDECHEMMINRSCKSAVVRPTRDHINRVAQFITYSSKAIENLKTQLFPQNEKEESNQSILSSYSKDKAFNNNVTAQMKLMREKGLFEVRTTNRGLINPMTNVKANPDQEHDLLNFRYIGEREFLSRVASVLLQQPSVQAPNRKRRLVTFSDTKKKGQRISQLERDRRLVMLAMRKKINHSKRTGKPIQQTSEQLITYPLAICKDGKPNKGTKSYTTQSLEARYKQTNVFTAHNPIKPECCLLEGMFIINTAPLGIHRTLSEYANFLMKRFIVTQFKQGCKEVHVIFDSPGRLANTPKFFEQARRDESSSISGNHYCDDLDGKTSVSRGKWRENLLNCRECKRKLVVYLGRYFLSHIHSFINTGQTLYIAGAFEEAIADTVWCVQNNNKEQPQPTYTSNAEETDTRIWIHASRTTCTKILLISADTDVYHIGLPLLCTQQKQVIVQVNPISSRQLKFINLQELIHALRTDPDLTQLDQALLPSILQTIYAASGCDYISFFSEIGKATFLRHFFANATFISGGYTITPGTLGNTHLETTDLDLGFLSFLRLIGTIYFKKYASGFDTQSPATYFKKFICPTKSIKEQHQDWINSIRDNIWSRTKFENQMIPSNEALYLHWQRTCWVLQMWSQADKNTIILSDMEQFGWKIVESTLTIIWDSAENIRNIEKRVDAILKGCRCSTGCATARCGCRKKGTSCLEGCECVNCTNMSNVQSTDSAMLEISIEEDILTTTTMAGNEEHEEELMHWVFGPELEEQSPTYSDTED